jgi:predicted metal-dependent hydrolase
MVAQTKATTKDRKKEAYISVYNGPTWQDTNELRWAARHWAVQIGVRVPYIHIRPMTTKWASISTAGRLTLDAGLVKLPKPLGEFVIVHELVHILAPNHGKLFKSFMSAYMPDWIERERDLQKFAQ